MTARPGITLALILAASAAASAQAPAGVELHALHEAATTTDPRYRALQLQAEQTELRLRNIRADRRPSFTAEGKAQYQTDVPTVPFTSTTGDPLFSPPKATYDTYLRLEQPLVDATIAARLATEEAALAETQARTRSALFALRQEVNDAFFNALHAQERLVALAASIADLEGRLKETAIRVREGAALPSEGASVEAALLRREQDRHELSAGRSAALARLTRLTGRPFNAAGTLAVPQFASSSLTSKAADLRARPEYLQFERTRQRLNRQQDLVTAQEKPRVSAFGRVGYGRPGLNFISDTWDTYGLAGIQIQWQAWDWGKPAREREALALQQRIVNADEEAFSRTLDRSLEHDLAAIDRLQRTLAADDRIVSLRDDIMRSTGIRFNEGVVTASEYLDRSTELLEARSALASHRIELAQASARVLTTLGLDLK